MAFRVARHRISWAFGIGAGVLIVLAFGSARFGNGALESVLVACQRMLFLFGEHLSFVTGVSIGLLILLLTGAVHAAFGAFRDLAAARLLERSAMNGAMPLEGMLRVFLTKDLSHHAWTAGCIRPRIYLSSETFARLSEGERSALVAHEMAHVRHHDVLKRALADATRRFFWFVPTVAELADIMRFGQEVRADRAAMAEAGKRALCGLYLSTSSGGAPSFVTGFAFVTPRLSEVLDGAPAKAELSKWRLAVSLSMVALLSFGGWHGMIRQAEASAPSTCAIIETMAPQSFTPLVGPLELYTPRPTDACSGNLSC